MSEIPLIMVIDDDAAIREAVQSLIRSVGLRAEGFASAPDCLQSGHLQDTACLIVDVRLVAATNRELAQMVDAGQFRADLYDRLHVFPITVPPLRQRAEDIPLLVRHFVRHYARQLGRRLDTIPAEAMAALTQYHWPGNVRELQHVIERAVILSPGPVLRLVLDERPRSQPAPGSPAGARTLEAVEREHILRVLQDAKRVIGGPHGAAARLGLRRTTLLYRLEKLGIARQPS